jgi:hypothetical protein
MIPLIPPWGMGRGVMITDLDSVVHSGQTTLVRVPVYPPGAREGEPGGVVVIGRAVAGTWLPRTDSSIGTRHVPVANTGRHVRAW